MLMLLIMSLITIGIIIAFFMVLLAPKATCPKCERNIKFPGTSVKCPHCKTKLFKKKDGSIEVA